MLNEAFLALSECLIASGLLNNCAPVANQLASTSKLFLSRTKVAVSHAADETTRVVSTTPARHQTIEIGHGYFSGPSNNHMVEEDGNGTTNVQSGGALTILQHIAPSWRRSDLVAYHYEKEQHLMGLYAYGTTSFEHRLHHVTLTSGLQLLQDPRMHRDEFETIFHKNIPPHTRETLAQVFHGGLGSLVRYGPLRLQQLHAERLHWTLGPQAADWLDAIDVSEYLKGKGINLDAAALHVEFELSEEIAALVAPYALANLDNAFPDIALSKPRHPFSYLLPPNGAPPPCKKMVVLDVGKLIEGTALWSDPEWY